MSRRPMVDMSRISDDQRMPIINKITMVRRVKNMRQLPVESVYVSIMFHPIFKGFNIFSLPNPHSNLLR